MDDKGESMLVKKVLSEQIKEQLIEDLLTKKYMPGDKLVESTIAKRFGVSQAPVREAMKGLIEMGFVTVEPYKGTTVRLMSKEDMWETLAVRAALESVAAGIAAQKITPEEIEELEQLAEDMTRAAEAGNIKEREAINVQLHNTILRISGHKLIMRLSKSLRFANWSQTTGTFTTMDSVELAKRHKKLIDPLKRHDAEGAAKAMREHIELSARSMLKSWKED
jgi:DNA-binding GntR family transcriptional regulator